MITYANCPLYWQSKLQSEMTLSTTEEEYIALPQLLWKIILLINLLSELNILILQMAFQRSNAGFLKIIAAVWHWQKLC